MDEEKGINMYTTVEQLVAALQPYLGRTPPMPILIGVECEGIIRGLGKLNLKTDGHYGSTADHPVLELETEMGTDYLEPTDDVWAAEVQRLKDERMAGYRAAVAERKRKEQDDHDEYFILHTKETN